MKFGKRVWKKKRENKPAHARCARLIARDDARRRATHYTYNNTYKKTHTSALHTNMNTRIQPRREKRSNISSLYLDKATLINTRGWRWKKINGCPPSSVRERAYIIITLERARARAKESEKEREWNQPSPFWTREFRRGLFCLTQKSNRWSRENNIRKPEIKHKGVMFKTKQKI